MAVQTQIQIRRGTAAQWTSANPILASGEFGYETDTGNFKIGDGTTAWNTLTVLNGVTPSTTATFTNKTINLSNNTLTGTLAQFNTACSDADFASLAGSETLTNKTISGANNTLSSIGNSSLTNSAITINGTAVSLGGSISLPGDIEGVTAGTGLTGGGTSGTVTISLSTPVSAANGGTGISSLGTGVATWLGTPTSANLRTVVADETGGGVLVFNDAPTLTGLVNASTDITLSAAGAWGSIKDYQTLNLMGCL
jgi:hypothetical protein